MGLLLGWSVFKKRQEINTLRTIYLLAIITAGIFAFDIVKSSYIEGSTSFWERSGFSRLDNRRGRVYGTLV